MTHDPNDAPANEVSHPAIAPPPTRPETGPLQFGDDWPGVFFRGDDALARGRNLCALRDVVAERVSADAAWAHLATLDGLIGDLAVPRDVGPEGQRLRPFGECLPRVGIPRPATVPPPVRAEPVSRLPRAEALLVDALDIVEALYEMTLDLATLVLRGEHEEAVEAASALVQLDPPPALQIPGVGNVPVHLHGWFWRALATAGVRRLTEATEAPNHLSLAVTVKVPPQAPAYAGQELRATVTAHRPGGHTLVETLVQLRAALAAVAREGGIPAEGRAALRALREKGDVTAPDDVTLSRTLAEALAPLPNPGREHAA